MGSRIEMRPYVVGMMHWDGRWWGEGSFSVGGSLRLAGALAGSLPRVGADG